MTTNADRKSETAIVPTDDVRGKVESLPSRVDKELILMFERLAKDPSVDVEKLERLIAMQERIMRYQSEAAFIADFTLMQPEIPSIDEDGTIKVDGKVRSNYATNEAIQTVLKPILSAHGFSLAFETDFDLATARVKVTGILAHIAGHSRTTTFVAPADTTGSKNAIQALGSTQSYGQRYTTKALLNIVSRMPEDRDDDGLSSAPRPAERLSRAAKNDPPLPKTPPPPPQPKPVPPQPSARVGRIVKVEARGAGTLVELDNGFICSTKVPDVVVALLALQKSGEIVELVTRDSRDPKKYAPVIEEILPHRS